MIHDIGRDDAVKRIATVVHGGLLKGPAVCRLCIPPSHARYRSCAPRMREGFLRIPDCHYVLKAAKNCSSVGLPDLISEITDGKASIWRIVLR